MSSELRVDKIVPTDGVPTGGGGGIIQVKQTLKTDSFHTTSQSYTDITGMTVSITPKFNTSKILLQCNIQFGGALNLYAPVRLLRDSTHIGQSTVYSGSQTNATFSLNLTDVSGTASQYKIFSTVYQILDSPATTSEVTYKLQVSSWVGRNFYINRSEQDSGAAWTHGASSSMTAMEVSA